MDRNATTAKQPNLKCTDEIVDQDTLNVNLRPSSPIFGYKDKFFQFYQVCIESLLGKTGLSLFHLKEYQVSWHKRGILKHNSIILTGMKLYMTKDSL